MIRARANSISIELMHPTGILALDADLQQLARCFEEGVAVVAHAEIHSYRKGGPVEGFI